MKKQFGQLETVVMDLVWRCEYPVAVREVLDELSSERDLAYTTVMTVMDNLFHKGVLTRSMGSGRAYRYEATRTRDEYTAELMEHVLADSADASTALLHFVERMPPADVAELRRILQRIDGQDREPS